MRKYSISFERQFTYLTEQLKKIDSVKYIKRVRTRSLLIFHFVVKCIERSMQFIAARLMPTACVFEKLM